MSRFSRLTQAVLAAKPVCSPPGHTLGTRPGGSRHLASGCSCLPQPLTGSLAQPPIFLAFSLLPWEHYKPVHQKEAQGDELNHPPQGQPGPQAPPPGQFKGLGSSLTSLTFSCVAFGLRLLSCVNMKMLCEFGDTLNYTLSYTMA